MKAHGNPAIYPAILARFNFKPSFNLTKEQL